jgi:uncharacterized protein YjbJ (UPF0337 family)
VVSSENYSVNPRSKSQQAKEVAGKLSNNPKLEAEDTVEMINGRVQEKIGQVKKVWGH